MVTDNRPSHRKTGVRSYFPVITLLFVLTISIMDEAVGGLYQEFQNPPEEFSLMPYWFWNGDVTPDETRRQIRLMKEQGVHSAIVFPWDGMRVPYLSEAWWKVWGDSLEAARELDFTLNMNDDFTWPSGHAWDHYGQGPELSRVLAGNPDYRMKTLRVEEISLDGTERWEYDGSDEVRVVVVGRVDPRDLLQPDSLRVLHSENGRLSWEVPEGNWKAFVYTPHEVTGAHNARVDPLNPAAVRKYLDLVYEPLAQRFPQHLGHTLKMTTADHEGTMGVHPVYTPKLWETFQTTHGYDLRSMLPLLGQKGAGRALEVRCDYFETVSALFQTAFVGQVTEWCETHGLDHVASFYEEQLSIQVERAGDMFGIWRTTSGVEIDALLERARLPIDFKEAVSVSHFEKTKLIVETQGLQGIDSFISPEKMRLGSNMALLWGADVLVPYFEYDTNKVQWPPQWFLGQPFRPYFHHYADSVRRATFMNSRGRHIAPVALYYPLEDAWAQSESRFVPRHRELEWGNEMDDTQAYYTALQLELSRDGWDYHILDSHYLNAAETEDSALRLSDESFRVVILPPLTTLSRNAMRKLGTFFDNGGTIITMRRLPTRSPQAGKDDPVILESVRNIFGEAALQGRASVNKSAAGGAAYFFPCGQFPNFMNVLDYADPLVTPKGYRDALAVVLETVDLHLDREFEVVRGEAEGVYASHRVEGLTHFYWVVNDSDSERAVTALVKGAGQAQRWDPETGTRFLLPSRQTDRGTEVDLSLEAWGGTYLVITSPTSGVEAEPDLETVETADLTDHTWLFKPESEEVLLPYAHVRQGSLEEGEESGWNLPMIDREGWTEEWLAVENLANPSWWLIGPFPYGDHDGYDRVFPPEEEIQLDAKYPDDKGSEIGWAYKTSPTYWVNARELLDTPAESVVYAYNNIYSPTEREAQLRVAFADSIKVWWNGQEKLAIHRHPKWMLLRDPWSEQVAVTLKEGWNHVLLKVCRSENRPISFLFRIANDGGSTLKDLVYSRSQEAAAEVVAEAGETWFRVESPPGTQAIVVPPFKNLKRVYINGSGVEGRPGETIAFSQETPPSVAFCGGLNERLERPIRFISGPTAITLGSWTRTPLAHYSGRATYETNFALRGLRPGESVELDCGSVGVTAEVWLNGAKVGERAWRPYRFDITGQVREGSNRLKIIVASSDANWLAQGDPLYPAGTWGLEVEEERDRLESIDPCGLVGPVTVRVQRPVYKN